MGKWDAIRKGVGMHFTGMLAVVYISDINHDS